MPLPCHRQEKVGVDVFEIGRENHLFCNGRSSGPCMLYLSVLGWESSSFSLIVYGVEKSYFKGSKGGDNTQKPVLLCAAGGARCVKRLLACNGVWYK